MTVASEELAQAALDAEVDGHTGEDHVVDAPLAQLQDQPPAWRFFLAGFETIDPKQASEGSQDREFERPSPRLQLIVP